MAQVIQTSFIVTISKLVKDVTHNNQVLDVAQCELIQQMLPGVVEEVLSDPSMIVEVHTIPD